MDTEAEPVESDESYEQPIGTWITYVILLAISFVINTIIIKTECKNRKSDDTLFVSNWLRISPLIVLCTGYGYIIFYMLYFIPSSCAIFAGLSNVLIVIQIGFMGIYQLSRLYYCFSMLLVVYLQLIQYLLL